MNKQQLVENIADQADITKAVAGKALDGMVKAITTALSEGDSVQLIGFGTFSVKERAARTGRNPQTGAALQIPKSNIPGFKAGSALKDAVN